MRELVPADDLLHPITDHPDHNESAYFNFASNGFIGWVRIGNRINDGFAEVTICLYLPDGRVAMEWKRAPIADPAFHNAGGLSFEVLESFVHHRVQYTGEATILPSWRSLEDPGSAFKNGERTAVTIDLDFVAVSPPWSGHDSDAYEGFAPNHFEQHMAVDGKVTVGDEVFDIVNGLSMRDHSWGPRRWQLVEWYRWLIASFSPTLGIAVTIIGGRDGNYKTQGYVHHGIDAPLRSIVSATLENEYDEGYYPTLAKWVLTDDQGETYAVTGDIHTPLPLRHRRDGQTTRIIEGPTVFGIDGTEGVGMSEYLDLMESGVPVGAAWA
jgi:hypothetical protein